MWNLIIGLVLGATLGAASANLAAQRSTDTFPDAVTVDPKHYAAGALGCGDGNVHLPENIAGEA